MKKNEIKYHPDPLETGAFKNDRTAELRKNMMGSSRTGNLRIR